MSDQEASQEEVTVSPVSTTGFDPLSVQVEVLSSADQLVAIFSLIILIGGILLIILRGKTTTESFFLSNRSLTFLPLTCSMIMSDLGAAQLVGVAGVASRSGVSAYAYQWNAAVVVVALGWIFYPVFLASGSFTTIDYIKKRFGSTRIEIYMALITIFLTISTKISVELFAVYKLLEVVAPDTNLSEACIPLMCLALLIPLSGGLKAVVYLNTLMAIMMTAGVSILSFFCIVNFPSYIELKEKFFEAWPNSSKVHFGVINSTYRYTTCGIPASTSWHMILDFSNQDLPWPGMMLGLTISSLWYWCCDQLIVQNGLGARNVVQCKYACIATGYFKILTILFLVLPGLVSRIIHTNVVACADPDICKEVCGVRSGCSNLAFPSIYLDIVPPNYRGLVLAAVGSCCVSSLAASLHSGGSIFTINIYRNIRSKTSQFELVLAAKMFVLCLALVSVIWVHLLTPGTGVYDYIQDFTSILSPPVLAVFLAAITWDRVTEQNAMVCLLGGLLVGLVRLIWQLIHEALVCGEEGALNSAPDIVRHYHLLHFAILLFVLCLCYIVFAGVFNEPILMVHLYRLTFWLRHSKLDRVELSELNAAYKAILADKLQEEEDSEEDKEDQGNQEKEKSSDSEHDSIGNVCGPAALLCCMSSHSARKMISSSEIRETSKLQVSIKESRSQQKALNIHAVLLLLVAAVMLGYFC